jgi:DtxR family Mn-dependent transcriptional regulator
MKTKKKLSESMENYLKTILVLGKRDSPVMVKDISSMMNVKTSSVTAALEVLADLRYVKHESYGYVELTSLGRAKARNVCKKNGTLLKFLQEILEINSKTAQRDACAMEHVISPQTFAKLVRFVEFAGRGPEGRFRNHLLKTNSAAAGQKKIKNGHYE